MQLDGKATIVYGGGGAMGGALARAFAAEGARVFLAGRTLSTVQAVADDISAAGGIAHAAEVDVDHQEAVDRHAGEVVATAGRLDVSCNAVGMEALQNVRLVDMAVDDFMQPILQAARRNFITATAAARKMSDQGHGVIIQLSASAAKEWRHEMGGFSLGCASIETLTRTLAGELKGSGVRVVCLRPNFTPQTRPGWEGGATIEALLADTMLPRLPRLTEVSSAAVFLASDHAGATTGSVLDLTCGAIVN